jgi:ketosteroid isomerase-like protein
MSANLDLVRSIYADWERGDFSSTEWAHPEIEYLIADGPDPATWRGPTGMAERIRINLSPWRDYHLKAEEYRELDEERVLVLSIHPAGGKTSGLEVEQRLSQAANLFHVRGGKVTRLVHYLDREQALADLGLAPGAG